MPNTKNRTYFVLLSFILVSQWETGKTTGRGLLLFYITCYMFDNNADNNYPKSNGEWMRSNIKFFVTTYSRESFTFDFKSYNKTDNSRFVRLVQFCMFSEMIYFHINLFCCVIVDHMHMGLRLLSWCSVTLRFNYTNKIKRWVTKMK